MVLAFVGDSTITSAFSVDINFTPTSMP